MTSKISYSKLSAEMGIDLQYTDFFKLEELQTIQDLFADATGVASVITHLDGTPITKPSNFCRLCESIVRQTPKGCKNCMKSDAVLSAQSNSLPSVQTCTSVGLMESSTQIIVHGVPVANWIIGQVRTPELDKVRMEQYANEIGANVDDFMKALDEVPIMTKEQLFNVSKMLVFSARQLAEKGTAVVNLKQKMAELENTNKLLHDHEELLSITLQSIGDGVISTDVNGLIANMNPMAEHLCGVKLENVLGKPLTDVFKIVSAESRESVENPIKKVLQTGQIAGLANHTILISGDGKEYQISDSAAPIIDKNGSITGVVLVFSDVTDKYLAESELRESERSKSVLLSNIPGMAYRSRYDRNWTKEFISEGCFPLTGYQISDLIDNKIVSFNDIIVPEFRDKLWKTWQHAVDTKTAVFVEYKIKTADNIEKWVWEQGLPIYNKEGEVEALEGLILDISDRKRAEQQLENERTMLRTLIDNIPEKIYSKDLDCRKTLANKAEIETLGCSSESEVLGKDDFAFFPAEYAQKFKADDKHIFESGHPKINYEELVVDKHGNSRWMLSSKIPLLDRHQNIIGLIGISRNITSQKKYEETLTNERLLLRTIIDNIPDCIYTKNASFQKTLANKAEVNLMGVNSEDDVLGKDDYSFYPKELADVFAADEKAIFETGEPLLFKEELMFDKDGKKRWILTSKIPLRDKDNVVTGIVGVSHDITENKQYAELIQNERILLRAVIDNIPDAIYIKDLSGRKTLANLAELKLTGATCEADVIGKTDYDLFPADVAKSYTEDDIQVIQEGIPLMNREGSLVDKEGNVHWMVGTKLPLYDNNNNIIGLLGVGRDITHRKRAEEALLESERFLKQTQAIAELGTYTIDLVKREWVCSDVLDSIFGIEAKAKKTVATWTSIIHPDFRAEIEEYLAKHVIIDKNKFDNKYKIIRQNDQEVRWVHGIGELVLDTMGNPIKLIGTVQDITNRKNLSEKLRKSEMLYRSTLTASPDIIAAVDISGYITMISPNGLVFYGCEKEEDIIGHQFTDFIAPEDIEKAKSNFQSSFTRQLGAIEYSIQKADGSRVQTEIKADIIRDRDSEPTGMVIIIRDITDRKKWETELSKAQEQMKKFAAHLQNVREEERLEIARELHDELGQILIAIKIDMGMLKQNILRCPDSNVTDGIISKFDQLFVLVDSTINTTRKIMTDLRPEVLYLLGFIEAAKLQVAKFYERYDIKCDFETEITDLELNPQQSVALYRIVQEALTNIAKHANATEVKVHMNVNGDKLILQISDNGVGIKENYKSKQDSYGLIGMQERAFLMDGEFTIAGREGLGTVVKVEIPYSENKNMNKQLEFEY
jgi:PAS domain S-box-containing protein